MTPAIPALFFKTTRGRGSFLNKMFAKESPLSLWSGNCWIDAIVQAETEMVNQEVASGLVSQEDADEWMAELDTFVAEFVEMGFMDDEMDEGMEENMEDGEGRTTGQSAPNTIKGASMTLGLHKNVQFKRPAAFPDNFVYLPAVMK